MVDSASLKPSTLKSLYVLRGVLPALLGCQGKGVEDADVLTPTKPMHPRDGFMATYETKKGWTEPEVKIYVPL